MKHSEFIAESSLSRIYQHSKEHSVGAITASRGNFSISTNNQRNRALASYLHNHGYGITVIDGGFIENQGTPQEREVSEKTFFVVNPSKGDDAGKLENDLIDLGQLYDQDSILSYRFGDRPTYIGTTRQEDASPAYGERYALTSAEWGNPSGPYFSSIRGRKFAYTECRDWQLPMTNNGRIGIYLNAKEVDKQLKEMKHARNNQ